MSERFMARQIQETASYGTPSQITFDYTQLYWQDKNQSFNQSPFIADASEPKKKKKKKKKKKNN